MTAIFNALNAGHGAEEILKYLSKSIPGLQKSIRKATSSGYNAKQILGFLSKNFETEDRRGLSESQIHGVNRRADSERAKYGLKMGAAIGATALAAPMAAAALQRALPNSLTGLIPQIAQQQTQQGIQQATPQPAQPGQTAPSLTTPSAQQPPINTNVPTNIPQPTIPQQPQINSTELLTKTRLKDSVDKILKEPKNGPEQVLAYFQTLHPEDVKKFEKETGQKFSDVVADYAQNAQKQPLEAPKVEEAIETPKIEKSSVVATPNGIGEVKEIRGDKAIVEVDGKLSKVNVKELESSPIPEKDLADLYNDLISGIESETEEEVSRMVDWAGYDPDRNSLSFLPYTGALYTYENISPEDAALLTSVLNVRKTSGSNFIGAWVKGSKSPIGAAMSALIKRLQSERGGKGKEYSAKHQTIYKSTEPAIEAAKAKKKEEAAKLKPKKKKKKDEED